MPFHLALKVPSKEGLTTPILGWRNLRLRQVSLSLASYRNRRLEPGRPLASALSFCLSCSGVASLPWARDHAVCPFVSSLFHWFLFLLEVKSKEFGGILHQGEFFQILVFLQFLLFSPIPAP